MIALGVSSEQRFVADLFEAAKAPVLRSHADFASEEIVIPDGPYRGLKFSADRQPFTRLLLNEFDSGRWRRFCVTGPSQSGKTLTAFVEPVLYHLFERKENVICGVPNLDMAGDKWLADFMPAIEASRYRDLLPTRGAGSKGGTPRRIQFKHGPSLLFMAGGGGDKQRAGATTRVLVITETDGMDEAGLSSREGDKISQLEARTRSYGLRALTYMECTISSTDGRTWREYESGSASRIICPCPGCGHWVSPEREHFVGWDGAETKAEAGRLAKFSCPDCGECYTEEQRLQMNLASRLLHRGQEITESGEIVGAPVETDTLGFRWSAFNNLLSPAAQIGQEEWSQSQSGDPLGELSRRQFVWCIPSEVDRADKMAITAGIVRGSSAGYRGRCSGVARGDVPSGSELTGFVDIGRRVLNWVVCGWGDHCHVIDYGAAETSQPDVVGDEVAIRDALSELLLSLNGRYPSIAGLVDSGNWNTVIYSVTNEIANWTPSKGFGRGRAAETRGSYSHPRASHQKRPSPDGSPWHLSLQDRPRIWVCNFDSDWYKHRVHGALAIPPLSDGESVATGCVRLFGDKPQEHEEFASQVVAEEWDAEKKEWVKKRKANHYLDCVVGNFVARSMGRVTNVAATSRKTVISSGEGRPDGRPW